MLRKPPRPHATRMTVGGAAVMTEEVRAPRWCATRLPVVVVGSLEVDSAPRAADVVSEDFRVQNDVKENILQ